MPCAPRAMCGSRSMASAWVLALFSLGCSDGLPLDLGVEPGPVHSPGVEVRFGGDGFQEATSLAVSSTTVFLGGAYAERLEYREEIALAGTSGSDAFVLGLSSDADANVRFIHSLAGVGDDTVTSVTLAPDEAAFAAGHVTEGVLLDGEPLVASPSGSAFLMKLDSEGGVEWARTGKGSGVQSVTAVAVATDGGVFAAGDFSGELDFGLGVLAAAGESDVFIARFSSNGEPEWIRTLGGEGPQSAHRLLRLSDGTLLLAGSFIDALDADGSDGTVNHSLNQTPFVAAFDEHGELHWAQSEVIAHDHLRYLEERGTSHHSALHTYVERLSLAERDSGEALAVVAHGEFLSRHGENFESPAVSTLTLATLKSAGSVGTRASLDAPKSLLQVAGALGMQSGTRLVGSFTGEVVIDNRGFFTSYGRRLLFARIADDGTLHDAGDFGLEGTGLTGHAASAREASAWVAARAVDLVTRDHDIFLGRFDF
jgi:hypothetical protein